MSGRGILDADMGTVGQWLRDAFMWWIDELSAMVPAALVSRSRRGPEIIWDGHTGFRHQRDDATPAPFVRGELARAIVVVPPSLCLSRTVELPVLGTRDMRALLSLEADRLMPLPGDDLFIAAAPARARAATPLVPVRIAALPRVHGKALIDALSATALVPSAIILHDGEVSIDFLPVMRDAGLISSPENSALPWWVLVACLFIANVMLLVGRDIASVSQLTEIVEAQRPAARAAQRTAMRSQTAIAVVTRAARRRDQQNALAMLSSISTAMPPGAWVQRYAWDGVTVRLTGYRNNADDPIKILRSSGLFADVRTANSDALAEIPAGKPFDLTARIGAR